MRLGGGLRWLALMGRVRVRLLVVDSNRPWMMLWMVGWRWQALRRVGVMLGGGPKSARCGADGGKVRLDGNKDKQIGQGISDVQWGIGALGRRGAGGGGR